VLFVLLFALSGSGQDASRADSTQAVQAALRSGEFARALEMDRALLLQFPRDARLWTFQAIALAGLKQNSEALVAYDKALKLSPDYLPALQGAAQLEYQAGSPHAIPRLDHILALQPNDPTSHAMLAVLAYKQHDCARAVKHFAQSTALISKQAGALAEYGACLMDLERAPDAIEVYKQIVTQFPEDPHGRYALASAEVASHQGQEAVETLQPLLEAKEPDADVLDLASSAYEDAGDTPKAVELLRRAILVNPRKSKFYVDFAILSFNHQSFQVGVDMLGVGLNYLPDAAPLYIARGILYIQMAQYDKGEADFQAAMKIDPAQASGGVAQGMALIQQSNLDEALGTVNAQLESHPKEAFLYYLKSQILAQKGAPVGSPEFKQAIEAATRATQLQPELVLPRDLLGSLYLKAGQLNLAIEQCRLALKGNPSDQESLYHLIQALRQNGKASKTEMAELVQRLADLRRQSREQEALANKYKLYEPDKKKALQQ
jgi:tetratricopeptide (TPR) repeat protein